VLFLTKDFAGRGLYEVDPLTYGATHRNILAFIIGCLIG
jgi:hypothetical protein